MVSFPSNIAVSEKVAYRGAPNTLSSIEIHTYPDFEQSEDLHRHGIAGSNSSYKGWSFRLKRTSPKRGKSTIFITN